MNLSLGIRLLWRDWRGGELGLLIGALTVAVTIVVGIAQFVERINGAILAESNEFIAADRLVRSNRALPKAWLELADSYNLRHAQVLHFPTMVLAGDDAMQLAAVKAVSADYPLLGALTIRSGAQQLTHDVTHGPPPGEVWADARLLQVLGLQLGDKLSVGNAEFALSAVVTREPDSGFSVFSYGPRLLMNSADIPATGVIQPGSRVQYNLLLQGDGESLADYLKELKPQLGSNQRVLGVRDSQPTLALALDRAESFLLLAGSMGVILAGIAIAIATRRYTERHFDYVAILRSLGATSRRVLGFYLTHLLLLSALAVVLGCLLGTALQSVAVNTVSEVLRINLPAVGGRPFLLGTATAVISFIAFALPAILHLQHVAPMRVLRRDLGSPDFNQWVIYVFGILGLVSIVYLYSGDVQITLVLSAGVAGVAAVVLLLTWLLLKSAKVTGMQASSPLALALAGIRRRAAHSALQVFVFTLALMLLLVLLLVRTSLLDQWRLQMPANTPNHFLLNIAPPQVDGVRALLADASIESAGLFPMVRGRISAVNGTPLGKRKLQNTDDPADANPNREINLTWSDALPADNELIAGSWWQANATEAQLSVESGFAERMQLGIGDKVSFIVAERKLTASVTSIRALDWQQMRPNFFMILSPGSLEGFPATYMTSFYLPTAQSAVMPQLLKTYPTIGVIEVDAVIRQVRTIIDRVSSAIELVLGLILLSGVIVLFASVQTSMDERYMEQAILKTLGARSKLLFSSLLYEFASLGLLAGSLAAVSSEAIVWFLQTRVLEIEHSAHLWVFVVGPLGGAFLVGALGLLISARTVRATPLQVLRDA